MQIKIKMKNFFLKKIKNKKQQQFLIRRIKKVDSVFIQF